MPLPDAIKKSPRVYTLLQNLDLENLSADDLADVGDPIAIEEANEDELRRLCLVAFARMVTKGSFDGWLTGGGGGEQAYQIPSAVCGPTGNFKYWNIATLWAGSKPNVAALNLTSELQFWNPFIAPQTAAPVGVSINVITDTTSQNLYVGFYESSAAGYPSTLLGYATISTDSTGAIRVTSFTEASTGSLTFTKGEQYYYSFNKSGTEAPLLTTTAGADTNSLTPDNVVSGTGGQELGIESVSSTTSAPADVADTTEIGGTGAGGTNRLQVWMDF